MSKLGSRLVVGAFLASFTGHGSADTSAFTIIDDPALNSAVAQVRSEYLATRAQNQPAFNQLNVVVLLPNLDGTWRRGSYNPNSLTYPASSVKLAYLASAMKWCRENGHAPNHLDADVGPMIRVSDNYATGRVIDTITGAPNIPDCKKFSDSRWPPFYDAHQYTEYMLAGRGLFENQIVLNKTYPTNSGGGPTGAEALCLTIRGGMGNRMQPKCAASLMLEIQKGALEPQALPYMKDLLTHDRWGPDSVFGYGLPPGAVYENKFGNAYDGLHDIAYIQMPNGKEMIMAAFSNAFSGTEVNQPYPYDVSVLGRFAEMMIDAVGLSGTGNPPDLRLDNAGPAFTTVGTWSTTSLASERYGADYLFTSGGTGTKSATWTLNAPETGVYEVSVHYSQGTNRATDAPYTVNHAAGSTTFLINQQSKGGRWVRLGDFAFDAGSGSITLTDAISDTSKVIIADAVRVVKWPGNYVPPPVAPGNLTATAVSQSQINLGWVDNSSDETDFVVDYKVGSGAYSELAVVPANSTSFSATGLARRTTYTFRVKARSQDGASDYSNEASATTPNK